MSENEKNDLVEALNKINAGTGEIDLSGIGETTGSETGSSSFKVAGANLPAKPSFWTKMKNVLFYDIKVELTPYQQKVENEINEFLHAPITWKSLKEAALSEVPITFRGKRVF